MLTAEDVRSIRYFLEDKGDVTRWSGWERAKPDVEREYPELIAALHSLNIAERTLKAVVDSMVGGEEDY